MIDNINIYKIGYILTRSLDWPDCIMTKDFDQLPIYTKYITNFDTFI